MPSYDYQCVHCEAMKTRQCKISERNDLPLCDTPACNLSPMPKRIGAAGFLLKGEGWYRDGYGLSSSEGALSKTD